MVDASDLDGVLEQNETSFDPKPIEAPPSGHFNHLGAGKNKNPKPIISDDNIKDNKTKAIKNDQTKK